MLRLAFFRLYFRKKLPPPLHLVFHQEPFHICHRHPDFKVFLRRYFCLGPLFGEHQGRKLLNKLTLLTGCQSPGNPAPQYPPFRTDLGIFSMDRAPFMKLPQFFYPMLVKTVSESGAHAESCEIQPSAFKFVCDIGSFDKFQEFIRQGSDKPERPFLPGSFNDLCNLFYQRVKLPDVRFF